MNGFRLPSKVDAILLMEHVDSKRSSKYAVEVPSQETDIPLNLVIDCVDDQVKNYRVAAREEKADLDNIELPGRTGD